MPRFVKLFALVLCVPILLLGCTRAHHDSYPSRNINLNELSGTLAVEANALTMELELQKQAAGISYFKVLSPPEIAGLAAQVTDGTVTLEYEGLSYTFPQDNSVNTPVFLQLSFVLDSLYNSSPDALEGYDEETSSIHGVASAVSYTAYFDDSGHLYRIIID